MATLVFLPEEDPPGSKRIAVTMKFVQSKIPHEYIAFILWADWYMAALI